MKCLLPQACTISFLFPDQHRRFLDWRDSHAILVSPSRLVDPERRCSLTRCDCSQEPTGAASVVVAVVTFTCPAQNRKIVTDLTGVQYVLGCEPTDVKIWNDCSGHDDCQYADNDNCTVGDCDPNYSVWPDQYHHAKLCLELSSTCVGRRSRHRHW